MLVSITTRLVIADVAPTEATALESAMFHRDMRNTDLRNG